MTPIDYSRQTTLITGASSGIGVEFARHLAHRGSDVVLVGRRQDRLEELAAELQAAYGVRAVPVALDLSAPDAGRVLAAEVDRRGLSVTSLINNAGFGADGPFHEQDPDRLRDLLTVNVVGLVDVTRALIGSLRAADHGVLINIASMAAYQPIPAMAVYAASKAFVLSFTEALWGEARGTPPDLAPPPSGRGGAERVRGAESGGVSGGGGARVPRRRGRRRLRPGPAR